MYFCAVNDLDDKFSISKEAHICAYWMSYSTFFGKEYKQSITGAKRMRLKTRIDGLSFDARLKALQAVTPSLVTVAGQTTKYEQSLSRR